MKMHGLFRQLKLLFLFLFLMGIAVSNLYAQSEFFYWEEPKPITDRISYFPIAATYDGQSYLFYEEVEKTGQDSGKISIYMKKKIQDSYDYSPKIKVSSEAYEFIGEVPDIYSVAISKKGVIAVASIVSDKKAAVYVSHDGGETFVRRELSNFSNAVVGLRVFASSDGGFGLFASLEHYENLSFSILFCHSVDGTSWNHFEPWESAQNLTNPFLPYLYCVDDVDLVVFQAEYTDGDSSTTQLYASSSIDALKTWSPAVLVTGPSSVSRNSAKPFQKYNNQRPVISQVNQKLYLAWERSDTASANATIWISQIFVNGQIASVPEQISNYGDAHRPVVFAYKDKLSLLWFDNRRGVDSIYLAQNNGGMWNTDSLVTMSRDSNFAYPIIEKDELSFIWQQFTQGNNKNNYSAPKIYTLQKDHTVLKPRLAAKGFTEGKRSTSDSVRAQISFPEDSSGITGYTWIITQDPEEEPQISLTPTSYKQNTVAAKVSEDGEWYLKVRVVDGAGNWSESASIKYYRDKTPPRPPVIADFEKDINGFLTSNTFTMNWTFDPEDDDVAGYSWNLVNIAPLDKNLNDTRRHPIKLSPDDIQNKVAALLAKNASKIDKSQKPAARNLGNKTVSSYTNKTNGLYVFSVRAVDQVGNIGDSATVVLLLNKYNPATVITGINKKVDDFGKVSLSLFGRGFTYDGTISEIYIDKDGKSPYDLTLKRGTDYKVSSDEMISGITIEDFEQGKYRIGLKHTDRGVYFTGQILTIDEYGTVKIEPEYEYMPEWVLTEKSDEYHISTGEILLWILALLALLGMLGSTRGLIYTARDVVAVKREVRALLTGEMLPMEKKRIQALNKKGMGLKLKLRLFTTMLVLMVVMIVSIPLGIIMTGTQEKTLAQGLEDRVNVLLDSMGTSVRAYLPERNELEINSLPDQVNNFNGALYATIIGAPRDGSNTNLDYVWATNDKEILTKIDMETFSSGESRIQDESVAQILPRFDAIDREALAQVGEISSDVNALNAELVTLLTKSDAQSLERISEINDTTKGLRSTMNTALNELARSGARAEPFFDVDHLDRNQTEYIFYKPVLYSQDSDDKYVHAVVLIKVSTESLIAEVDSATYTILYISAGIALLAILIGLFGSSVIASIIVKPIRMLENHVKKIGETQDKEKLDGYEIEIHSRDEIRTLGDSINDMTRGLVKAAKDEKIAMEKEKMELDGKAVQQTFIPLNPNREGKKETTAALDDKDVQFFGYYEGADAVSGDYFDYKKLDDRWYAIIKCDVSGHGVPAALIMTAVATQFRKYFETWSFKKDGIKLNDLVTSINDFIESLGVKGKFATLMVCLFDTKTGDVYMCNAGDNIIHIYDAQNHVQKKLTLHEAPAAGPLPSFMVEMKGGFKVEKVTLKKDDVLFLYTDGIEEATRFFRNHNFEIDTCREPGFEEGQEHANHKVGQQSEQMEPERVKDIVESIFNRRQYQLHKYHCPDPQEELVFDFSKCDGTIEECILALAAVEKVFRLYKRPQAQGTVYRSESGDVVRQGDTVRVDRKIDAFLSKTFNHYEKYCSEKMDLEESNYLYYVNINEDPQADDLTLLALKKN